MYRSKYKTIFPFWIKAKLDKLGFIPITEEEDKRKPGFKCWIYENTPEFQAAFTRILKEGRDG